MGLRVGMGGGKNELVRTKKIQWLWLSWQSDFFLYQRPAVQIPVIGKIWTNLLLTVEKPKIKKKETVNGPFKKENKEWMWPRGNKDNLKQIPERN